MSLFPGRKFKVTVTELVRVTREYLVDGSSNSEAWATQFYKSGEVILSQERILESEVISSKEVKF